jgi:enoyl-CoA hydratase/carnithine racemase
MSDAIPASLVDGTPDELKADLIAILGKENVFHRAIDLVRYASDASPYRLIPQVVVLPRTTDDIVKLFRYCHATGRHATFRAAGTSLNGQSLSNDILIDVRRHWNGGKVEDDGRRVRVRPGMILSHINMMLEPYSRRLGPDPASSAACTIGGVIANNAGGMRCTVQKDAYHTVSALTFVTPSGAAIDTSKPDAEKAFVQAEPQLAEGLLELRRELLADPVLAERVRRKYAIRNTHGLRLCALPDFFIAHSGLGRVGAASKTVSPTRNFRLTQTIGERFRNMPKATIAKVEGRARGGGSEIALAMDMCFAALGKAIFGQPEVAVGLVPGGGSTQRLPRLIGRGRALEVLLGCNDLSAELAERYGYINRALPEDELTPFVEKLAHRIASFPAHTVAHVKAAVDIGAFGSMAEGLLVEAHESDLSVASEVTQARVREALKVGAETYEGELEMDFLSRLSLIRQ